MGCIDFACFIKHAVSIAVVSCDKKNNVIMLFDFRNNSAHARINGFHCFDGGIHDAGVADHIAVGKVADDEGILVACNGFDYLIADLFGAHLRDKIVGGELLGRRHQAALFTLADLFHTAVEEECDVGIFFSFGNAELLQPERADIVAQGILNDFRRICNGQSEIFIILRRADIGERIDFLFALKAVKLGQVKSPGHLSGTVRAEVHKDNAVTLIDHAFGGNDRREHELVGKILLPCFVPCLVTGFHSVDRIVVLIAFTADDAVIALLYAVPALVTVHTPETALDGGDFSSAELFALFVQLCHKTGAARGSDVTPVEEAVNICLLHAALLGHIQHTEDVLQVAVYAAG